MIKARFSQLLKPIILQDKYLVMHYLLILIAIVNIIAVMFFAALYTKRVKLDNYRKEAEKFEVSHFANQYLSV